MAKGQPTPLLESVTIAAPLRGIRFEVGPDLKGRVRIVYVVAGWQQAFWLSVTLLIEGYCDRTGRCAREGCGRYWVRSRHKMYCSERCAVRVRSKRSYQKHRKKRVLQARQRRARPVTKL